MSSRSPILRVRGFAMPSSEPFERIYQRAVERLGGAALESHYRAAAT